MTEDEAKTKVCHRTLAALAVPEVGSFHQFANCIGSACMAWRETRATELYHKIDGTRIGAREIYMRGNEEKRERVAGGYCGLAGPVQ
jgi:hypothetical protein